MGPHAGFDPRRARWLLGKRVIVGLTYVASDGSTERQSQFCGVVVGADASVISLERAEGTRFTLPPATGAFRYARRGEYRLRATGEVIVDPDATASWVVEAPSR